MFPFEYPSEPRHRRHGPAGYAHYESYRPWLRDEFTFCCVYCLKREQWGVVRRTFDIDHFCPQFIFPDGKLEYDNLLYACAACNTAKRGSNAPDPCEAFTKNQMRVYEDGRIEGLTPKARQLIRVLGLDDDEFTEFRATWIQIANLVQKTSPELYEKLMGFPKDLPNLSRLRPPKGNSRPEGVKESYFAKRKRGELTKTY